MEHLKVTYILFMFLFGGMAWASESANSLENAIMERLHSFAVRVSENSGDDTSLIAVKMDCGEKTNKVICTFYFTNRDDQDYYLFESYTPFEGFGSPFVTVTKSDESQLDYKGVIAERYLTTKKHLVHLKAGTTKSVSIEVSSAYNFNGDGIYTIHYNTPLVYMSENEFASLQETDSVSKAKFLFKPVKLSETVTLEDTANFAKTVYQLTMEKEALEEIIDNINGENDEDSDGDNADESNDYDGESDGDDHDDDNDKDKGDESDNDDESDDDSNKYERRRCRGLRIRGGRWSMKRALKRAHNLLCQHKGLYYARNKVKSNKRLTKKWFGVRRWRGIQKVYRNFGRMAWVMNRQTVNYDLTNDDSFCLKNGYYGYAFFNSRKVYLCDDFFRFPRSCRRNLAYTQEGALVHEWSHAVLSVHDNGYGTTKALKLARKKPGKAIDNAENYHFFYCDAKYN